MARPRSQSIIVALLLGTLALIFYGSLYPFDIVPRANVHSLIQAVSELAWARAGRGDRIANVLLYAPLGFCLLVWFENRLRRGAAVVMTVIIGIVLSFCIEVTQVFIALRVPSWWDVTFNGIGAIVGATAGIAWRELTGRMRGSFAVKNHTNRSAVLVLALWLAWRFAPYALRLDLGKFKSAFAPLANPYFSLPATLHYLVWWTLLAHILITLVSEQRGIEALLALIAVVLASCLVIAGNSFVPSELLALMLLLPTLFLFNRLTPAPRRFILLGAISALLLYDSFVPFETLDHTRGFDLWPFMAWIDAGFPIDWSWLARRACYFAALVWTLKEAGLSTRSTIIFAPLTVLCIEIAKIWSFGHHASITEPALALAIAWIMRILDAPRLNTPGVIRQRARNR